MDQPEDIPEREASIREVVGAMVRQRSWGLLSEAELIRRIEPLLGDDPLDKVGPVLFHIYAQALHGACAGLEGEERQRLGFEELFRYLHDVAWHIARDLPPDDRAQIVDRTLAEIYERLVEPRESRGPPAHAHPAAFLAVAAQQLLHVMHTRCCGVWVEWDGWAVDQAAPAEVARNLV